MQSVGDRHLCSTSVRSTTCTGLVQAKWKFFRATTAGARSLLCGVIYKPPRPTSSLRASNSLSLLGSLVYFTATLVTTATSIAVLQLSTSV